MWLYQAFVAALGFWFPDQGSNPSPLHWERGQGSPNKNLYSQEKNSIFLVQDPILGQLLHSLVLPLWGPLIWKSGLALAFVKEQACYFAE